MSKAKAHLAGFSFESKRKRDNFINDLVWGAKHAFKPKDKMASLINHIVLSNMDLPDTFLADKYVGPMYRNYKGRLRLVLDSTNYQIPVEPHHLLYDHQFVSPRQVYTQMTCPEYPDIDIPTTSFLTGAAIRSQNTLMFIHHPSPLPIIMANASKEPRHQKTAFARHAKWVPVSTWDMEYNPELYTPSLLTG